MKENKPTKIAEKLEIERSLSRQRKKQKRPAPPVPATAAEVSALVESWRSRFHRSGGNTAPAEAAKG